MEEIFKELSKPFSDKDLEWRVQSGSKDPNKLWALIIPYVQSRAIMDRLDKVLGFMHWSDQYIHLEKGVECRLTIIVDGKNITKCDGAPETNIESFKGGYSDSLKRAAVKFGIGRYLYDCPQTFANFVPKKTNETKMHKINNKYFYWLPPKLNGRSWT